MQQTIAICGAGIAGLATGYFLSTLLPDSKIILIDKHQPMSFTSSKSGENFRDYWPHPSMEALSSHSIALMTELREHFGDDAFDMHFSGYHFVSHQTNKPIFADDTTADFRQKNDVLLDPKAIQAKHPYLDDGISKSVFIKNAGNLDAYALGSLLLRVARQRNLHFQQTAINKIQRHASGYTIHCTADGEQQTISCDQVVLATGPFLPVMAQQLDIELPAWNTCQAKFIIPDPNGVIPPNMPFTIYADGQTLQWTKEEQAFLEDNDAMRWMTAPLPGGIHIKPEAGGKIKMGWAFSSKKVIPHWQPTSPDHFPQIVLKGASRFIPGLSAYAHQVPTPVISYAGYYTRTQENWPLIGASHDDNVFIVGALAGFGTMTACAAGELCARHIAGESLPWYAPYFHPLRYEDEVILAEMDKLQLDGQL